MTAPRLTGPDWVVNALVIHQNDPQRMVMVGDDGGKNFRAAKDAFNHRQVTLHPSKAEKFWEGFKVRQQTFAVRPP